MGGAGVAVDGDAYCRLLNPALTNQQNGIGLMWGREFGIPELSRATLCLNHSVGRFNGGLSASTFGSDLYRESALDILISGRLMESVSGGIQAGIRSLTISNSTSGSALSITAGMKLIPFEGLTFGAVWRHLNSPELSGYQGPIPESLTIGAAMDLPADSKVAIDIVQEPDFPAEYRFGVETPMLTYLKLRIGARAEPVRPSAGFEVSSGRWHISYAGDLHPELGASHTVGLSFGFGT